MPAATNSLLFYSSQLVTCVPARPLPLDICIHVFLVGDPLGFSAPDRRFIVKELNKGDHESLTDLTQSYIEHVTDRKGSLLCRFYAHFAVDGKNYVMMNNVLPPSGEYKAQYDLKGCADDKTLLRDGVRVRERASRGPSTSAVS